MTNLTPDQLASLDIKEGWPLPDVAQAVAVELAESGGDPNITNPVTPISLQTNPDAASGLFQDLPSHNPAVGRTSGETDAQYQQALTDPTLNTQEALSLFQSGGWGPWETDQSIISGANDNTGQQAVQDVTNESASQINSVFATTPSGTAAPANAPDTSAISSGGGLTPVNLTGTASVFQEISDLLNPNGPTLTGLSAIANDITGHATTNLIAVVETLVIRGIFAVSFILVTYLGIKMVSGGGGGGSTSITDIIQTGQAGQRAQTAQQNAATRAADVQRKSQPGYGTTTRVTHNINEERTTKTSHQYHHKASEAAGAAKTAEEAASL